MILGKSEIKGDHSNRVMGQLYRNYDKVLEYQYKVHISRITDEARFWSVKETTGELLGHMLKMKTS